jgi:hypothetical protein
LLILLIGHGGASADVTAVWAVDDGTKIKRFDLDHRLQSGNRTFNKEEGIIRLVAARNEIVAFQLILHGGSENTQSVNVRLPNVGDIKNEGLSDDPKRYFIGRRIELFVEHYVKVDSVSHDMSWEAFTDAMPRGWTGMVPDPLVPLQKSFMLPKEVSQGIWVDIFVPKETRPGIHKGTITVEVDGKPCALKECQLEVELEVLEQTLPDEATAKSMVWFSGGDDNRDVLVARYTNPEDVWEYPDEEAQALRTKHFQLGRRHRVTMFIGDDEAPNDELTSRLSGQIFTSEAGYEGPAEGVGQDLYSLNSYGSRELSTDDAKMWTEWFAANYPDLVYFFYTRDEPGSEDYPEVNQLAAQAEPVPSFVTAPYVEEGLDVDIYTCLPNHFNAADIARGNENDKRVWVYNGMRPYSGTYMTDDFAVSPRVNPWLQYKFDIERWFYWEATYYKDVQGDRGHVDVFKEANNFRNASGDRLNGDGLLIYPGRDSIFPSSNQGFDGPLPSIRLKNWRRGIQDVEYLVLARDAGHGEFVDKLVSALLPKAFDQVGNSDEAVSWSDDGEKWLEARQLLAEALKSGTAPEVPNNLAPEEDGTVDSMMRSAKRFKRKWSQGKRRKLLVYGVGGGFTFLMGFIVGALWMRRRLRRAH